MDIYKNARSCPASRELLVSRVLKQGWSVAEAAEAAGLSKRTGYKWLRRYKAAGLSGLTDRSSCPHHQPSRTPKAQEDQIIALRFQRMTGSEIASRVKMPRSTVARVLKRAGLARLQSLEPAAEIDLPR